MTDNVISLGTRKSLAEDKAEKQAAEETLKVHLDEAAASHKANMLGFLENLKARVEADEIDGLVLAGRNPANGAFLSTAIMNTSATRVDTYLAYAGILSALQLDMTDLANSGPHMNSDGSYFAVGTAEELLLGEDDD
ncbi:hypothetical protein PXK56_18095 [Phaeobacter gallaeciensis]|uniref:hypothetical protein n=1 Tax=Phaeobacter gallaeciensis TaxID=60890 RepID=UPI0023805B45|nr:hypothetical protein [Phaeobacter gallaeciensis]MDE4297102.1 hypothetical protein [Phaeobacter gallaeciensis]